MLQRLGNQPMRDVGQVYREAQMSAKNRPKGRSSNIIEYFTCRDVQSRNAQHYNRTFNGPPLFTVISTATQTLMC